MSTRGAQWQIRNFLICQPAPEVIRITSGDGLVQEMKPGRRSRSKLAETIEATDPALIECLGKQGELLRALRPNDETRGRSAEAPPPVKGLEGDPQAAMMSHFANLLHRAYEHATDVAFEKLIDLVERMDARTSAIEQRLERTEANYRREQQDRIDDLYDRAEEHAEQAQNGGKDAILNTLVTSAVNGHAARVQEPTNGKGKAS
jgi:hypothetical protein